ncbi:conserved protein of unknown function [Tenacibaculum sp. 190524A02b]|uniref:hypothetical protein n=1 Tax=Tenacibaculum vairaonense TaxID=3137860 RepID=UPI0032B1431D
MKKISKNIAIGFFFLTLFKVHAQEVYHLLVPSRDGKKENIIQIGNNNGTELFVMASCKKCMPAVYQHNKEASDILGKKVYGTSGIYVLPYDENSYVAVAPKAPLVALGQGIWKTFYYTNFFSTDKNKVSTMTTEKVTEWAIALSTKIMTGDKAKVDANSSVYFPAVRIAFAGGKKQRKVLILKDEKELAIGTITKEASNGYKFLPEYSKVLGMKVYGDSGNLREYVFVESEDAIIWAKFSHGNDLGRSAWGKHEVYNYFHRDETVIRKLLVDKRQQDALDAKLSDWSLKIKKHVEEAHAIEEAANIKNRRLPKRGMQNTALEAQALVSAKNWAKQYQWKETVTKTYFTGNDWGIYRNKLTGIQLGRRISGVVVMKRPDGRCSFHYATFTQQYNGKSYQKVFLEGITPGQQILECIHVNK